MLGLVRQRLYGQIVCLDSERAPPARRLRPGVSPRFSSADGQPGVLIIIIIIILPHFAASRQGLDCVGDLSDRDLSQAPVRESARDQ